jgi:hypothetical protein
MALSQTPATLLFTLKKLLNGYGYTSSHTGIKSSHTSRFCAQKSCILMYESLIHLLRLHSFLHVSPCSFIFFCDTKAQFFCRVAFWERPGTLESSRLGTVFPGEVPGSTLPGIQPEKCPKMPSIPPIFGQFSGHLWRVIKRLNWNQPIYRMELKKKRNPRPHLAFVRYYNYSDMLIKPPSSEYR